MTMSKILKYTFALLLANGSLLLPAQTLPEDTVREETRVRGIQYESREEAARAMSRKEQPLFAGFSISGDLCGAIMAAVSPYGQYEAAARANFKNRFFPTFEMGWGVSNHTDETTQLHYKTNAPYFRIGCDYNFANDASSGNRIFGGLRYAFTSFSYDLDGPAVTDPVWGTQTPFRFNGVSSGAQWGEVLFGLEAKVWGFFHLGWTFRYRFRFHVKNSSLGTPWYIPGYGKSEGHSIGGTFNIVFDI